MSSWAADARTTALVARAGELLHLMVGWGLANTLWAVAKLGLAPKWVGFWVELTRDKLAGFSTQELSNSIYALGQLDHHPGKPWMEAFWGASLSVLRRPVAAPDGDGAAPFKTQEMANIVCACGARV